MITVLVVDSHFENRVDIFDIAAIKIIRDDGKNNCFNNLKAVLQSENLVPRRVQSFVISLRLQAGVD